ncbi:UNVERIFIED_CONTAM: hypothetical protein HDU68_011789 [Siphonaria sp. JEL0065]|nr:hypothetical protein HDU68_011789 [Siphonaria sp. JEL0065]
MSFFGRLGSTNIKTLIREQGPAAFVTYSAVSVVSFGLWCGVAHHTGIDQQKLLAYLPSIPGSSGTSKDGKIIEQQSQSLRFEQMAKDVVRDVSTQVHRAEHAIKEGFEKAETAVMEGLEKAEHVVMDGIDKAETAVASILHPITPLPLAEKSEESSSGLDLSKHGTVIAVAWVAHNITFPVRLGLTAALTPFVASKIRGGYVDTMLKRYMTRFSAASTFKSDSVTSLKTKMVGIRK